MNHLIICREYPPAPSGGIGTYVVHISRLLAESGETVHVIGQQWEGAEKEIEEKHHGRLIIHRVPFEDWTSFVGRNLHQAAKSQEEKDLYQSGYAPQCFSWQVRLLAEHLIEQEGIDILEAQEFEAPLYYIQLRRALGLGPKRRPVCLVHLHSPSEFIARHNDWNPYHIYFRTAKRLEDYTIAAADALLCPSRYLARQAESHYGLAEGSIQVIPLPCGDSPYIERDRHTWENGTICYVGRLEQRKGVIEWVDAAVSVAPEYPAICFEFVGANLLGVDGMSVQELLERRIPRALKGRFMFRGEQKRPALRRFLSEARMSVVPSRWENFPNTCIEAMRSGLPVIVSPEGGMAEMIEDGRTGWLAESSGSEDLAQALRRALETPWTKLVEMGRHASSAIRRICDDKKILEDQLKFRSQIAHQRPRRSMSLPVNLPWAKRPLVDESARRIACQKPTKGLAIVIVCRNNGQWLDACLRSIDLQTQKPASVVIVDDRSTEEYTVRVLSKVRQKGWQVIQKRAGDLVSAKNAGIEAILAFNLNPLGFTFLGPEDRLQPGFVAACEGVLRHCREVGLVSCWAHHPVGMWVNPCPAFPYQWLSNEAVPFSAIRTEALREARFFGSMMSRGYDDWDLVNAVMAAGWDAVTFPEILGSHSVRHDPLTGAQAHGTMRRALLERFPELIARDAKDILLLSESERTWSPPERVFGLRARFALVRTALRYPRMAAVHVSGKVKSKICLAARGIWG